MRFEEFFRKMYAVGVDMAYEILKHVAPLFRQQWNYDAAYRFIRCKRLLYLSIYIDLLTPYNIPI